MDPVRRPGRNASRPLGLATSAGVIVVTVGVVVSGSNVGTNWGSMVARQPRCGVIVGMVSVGRARSKE